MKKGISESRSLKRDHKFRFNLSACNLACFKSFKPAPGEKIKVEGLRHGSRLEKAPSFDQKESHSRKEPRVNKMSSRASFNERVVFMYYDNQDVYIDRSTQKKGSKSSRKSKSLSQSSSQDSFISDCVRVITEETDNTSHNLSKGIAEHETTYMPYYSLDSQLYSTSFQTQTETQRQTETETILPTGRNKRSVTFQESKNYVIDFDKIQSEGRTTVMVKNIPNKYSQEMLLEDFCINHLNKFDFFYLPIDKDNNCNVGYAFVNFITPLYLREFFEEFHMKKWKRYRKSPKICHISYARYQGTLQLANHFRHTKIIHQKDKKVRPLIGLSEANKIHEIVKNQQGKEEMNKL